MTSTENRSTPNYIRRYSGATGRQELVCRHCGGSIAQNGNPREVEYIHLDLVDEGHPGYFCAGPDGPQAEPAVSAPVLDMSERIFASVEQSSNAFRIRRAIREGLAVSPEFRALAATGDDAALIEAAKTEGGAR